MARCWEDTTEEFPPDLETIDAFMGCDNMRLVVHPPPSGEPNIKRDCVEVETRNDTEGSITVCQCSRTQEIVVSKQVTWKWNETQDPTRPWQTMVFLQFLRKGSPASRVPGLFPRSSGAPA